MNLAVTVDASLTIWRTRPVISWKVYMPAVLMTVHAEEGPFRNQHSRVIGTVRVMAVQAALPDWRMFPQIKKARGAAAPGKNGGKRIS